MDPRWQPFTTEEPSAPAVGKRIAFLGSEGSFQSCHDFGGRSRGLLKTQAEEDLCDRSKVIMVHHGIVKKTFKSQRSLSFSCFPFSSNSCNLFFFYLLCWLLLCQCDKDGVIWEERTFIELPPSLASRQVRGAFS